MKNEMKYFYVYVLQSKKDGEFYKGYSSNLNQRILQHEKGEVTSTKHHLPIKLIYWEGCLCQQDATKREKYLKSAWGKRYIKNRLSNYLTG